MRGEGAEEVVWARRLDGVDCGVDGGDVGGGVAGVDRPVQEDDARDGGVGE